MVRKNKFGKVQKNVEGYDIREIVKGQGTLGVYRGKNLVQGDFKNQNEAIAYIKSELL